MKIFNNNAVTKKQLRLLFCNIAKEQGVSKVTFSPLGKFVAGSYNPQKNSIFIDNKETKRATLSVMFHELAHHVAVKEDLWKEYHFNLIDTLTAEEIFDIENNIDKIGEKLWNKYVKVSQWGKYKYSYPKSNKKQIIELFIKKHIKR